MTFAIANLDRLVPLQGVCYSPAPSDDAPAPPLKYFDTDFSNSCFPLLWGGEVQNGVTGRDDIKTLAGIGVNFIHLYNWSVPPAPGTSPGPYQRDHRPFLKAAAAAGIRVMVPVSNYFIEQIHQGNSKTVATQIAAMVTEVYDAGTTPSPGAGMWGIANEFDLAGGLFTVNDVVTAMELLVAAETAQNIPAANLLPICAPVSFAAGSLPPGIAAMQSLQVAIAASTKLPSGFWADRMVAALNSFNDGSFLSTYISTTFPQYFPGMPFFLSEMGINTSAATPPDDKGQAKWVAGQLADTVPSGNFLGRCVFQFLDQTAMKTGTEATFGMTKFDTSVTSPTGTIPAAYQPGGGETYPVDVLTQKPLFDAVKTAYTG